MLHAFSQMDNLASTGLVFLASIIEIWVAIKNCEKLADCEKENAYAIAVGAISITLTVAYFAATRLTLMGWNGSANGMVGDVIASLLVAFWLAAIAVCTMEGPFSGTADNGAPVSPPNLPVLPSACRVPHSCIDAIRSLRIWMRIGV